MQAFTVEDIEDWLAAKPTTSWVNWDITDPKERREAAEWFYNQLASYNRFVVLNHAVV